MGEENSPRGVVKIARGPNHKKGHWLAEMHFHLALSFWVVGFCRKPLLRNTTQTDGILLLDAGTVLYARLGLNMITKCSVYSAAAATALLLLLPLPPPAPTTTATTTTTKQKQQQKKKKKKKKKETFIKLEPLT